MSDLAQTEARWQEWMEVTARDLGVDPQLVDIAAIHDLTRVIAHDLDRPMAPVGAYLLGLAVGAQRSPNSAIDAVKPWTKLRPPTGPNSPAQNIPATAPPVSSLTTDAS